MAGLDFSPIIRGLQNAVARPAPRQSSAGVARPGVGGVRPPAPVKPPPGGPGDPDYNQRDPAGQNWRYNQPNPATGTGGGWTPSGPSPTTVSQNEANAATQQRERERMDAYKREQDAAAAQRDAQTR